MGLANVHCRDLGNGFSANFYPQGFFFQAGTPTIGTGHLIHETFNPVPNGLGGRLPVAAIEVVNDTFVFRCKFKF